ncbi:hypothetical protein CPB85DRAFT_1459671 [Mucidula mucida]|nr:hypothetical protein CPB85DRAFT_1459671 [Mucidula mucida]
MTMDDADTLSLREQRAALRASTTGHTVQVPVDAYFATYLTDILPSRAETDGLISWLVKGLKRGHYLNNSGWARTQVKTGVKEDATYKGLERIAEKIHDLCMTWNKEKGAAQVPKRTTRFVCRPNLETKSEVRGGSMRTDGRFILMESSDGGGEVDDENVRTCDVGGGMEAKLDVKDRGTNEDQIVNAVSHILYNDPCRRYVLSFTVEGNMMRFWYFSRSHIAVSEDFNYHENPEDFIRFIIFMTFATLEGLGYDPTVTRLRDAKDDVQYRFTVGDKVYQTVRCIDESSALDIITRATRVWAVQELDAYNQPLGKTEVLKDVWLYFDAKSEEDIQNEIFKALEDLDKIGVSVDQRPPTSPPGVPMAEDAKQYFMTIVKDIAVQVNGQDDTTLAPPDGAVEYCYTPLPQNAPAKEATVKGSRGKTAEAKAKGKGKGKAAANTGVRKASAKPQATAPLAKDSPVYPHTRRTHRRIVFAEECQTLYTMKNYGDFALGLAQLVYGLDYMRLAGFIHRDISPGNCLMYMEERHIKISDLEYARRYDSQCQSILPLTGTPGFMAVEYQAMEHYFPPDSAAKQGKSWKDVHTTAHKPQGKKSWFQFNFLHDLESVLWMLLSHLLTTVPNCLRADAPDVVEKHGAVLVLYDKLFDGSLKGSLERHNFVRNIKQPDMPAFTEAQEVLIAFYEEANALPLCNIMSAFVYLVRNCYKVVENTVPCVDQVTPYWDPAHFKHQFYRQIHDIFMEMHRGMAGVGYCAADELKKASNEPGPPSPPIEHETKDQVAPNPDSGPSRSRKRHADVSVDEAQKKKPKTDTDAQPSRPGKRPAEDAAVQAAKRPKRATAPAAQPLRRSTRLKSAASSDAAKGPKTPVRKTKQAAVKARAPSGSGAGTSAAGTSGQPAAAASSRQLRGERPVAGTKRVSKSTANKKS